MSAQETTVDGVFEKPLRNWPGHIRCSECEHRGGVHRFLYGVMLPRWGRTDRYRCEAILPNGGVCNCGEEYVPKVFVVPERLAHLNDSDGGRRQLIEMISRGEIPEVYKPK